MYHQKELLVEQTGSAIATNDLKSSETFNASMQTRDNQWKNRFHFRYQTSNLHENLRIKNISAFLFIQKDVYALNISERLYCILEWVDFKEKQQ